MFLSFRLLATCIGFALKMQVREITRWFYTQKETAEYRKKLTDLRDDMKLKVISLNICMVNIIFFLHFSNINTDFDNIILNYFILTTIQS